MDTQGHSIIPGQLEAALRNGRPASVTGMKRKTSFTLASIDRNSCLTAFLAGNPKKPKNPKMTENGKTQKMAKNAIVTNEDGLIVKKAQKKFLGVFLGFCSPKTTLFYCVPRKRGAGS